MGKKERKEGETLEVALREGEEWQRQLVHVGEKIQVVAAKKQDAKKRVQQCEQRVQELDVRAGEYDREYETVKTELREAVGTTRNALQDLREMRQAHANEIRLLHRGLQPHKAKGRERVDELAELMEHLGRAVQLRDRAIQERSRAEAEAKQLKGENRKLQQGRVTALQELSAAEKRAKKSSSLNRALKKPKERPQVEQVVLDPELESALCEVEKRFIVLDEGAAGLQETARRLESNNQVLRRRAEDAVSDAEAAERQRDHWAQVVQRKQERVAELRSDLEKVRANTAKMRGAIDARQKEIEAEVSRQTGSPVHFGPGAQPFAEVEQSLSHPPVEPDPVPASPSATPELPARPQEQEPRERTPGTLVASMATYVKTGELVQLEVHNCDGEFELRANDITAGDWYTLPLERAVLDELDEADPFAEVFSVVGFTLGPPKSLVLPQLVGRDRLLLPPESALPLLLSLYKYDQYRWFVSGFDEESIRQVDLVLTEEQWEVAPSGTDEELFDFFRQRLELVAQGERLKLVWLG